ncbi:MAG: hypothetical protein HQL88_05615 [Magnetococcales bacterium]|nr:hypothetical protein [Magnetococcales bacterium]
MNAPEKSKETAEFQVESPLAVFAAYSQEELRRCRDTEAHYDTALHQEAVALVTERLKASLGGSVLKRKAS